MVPSNDKQPAALPEISLAQRSFRLPDDTTAHLIQSFQRQGAARLTIWAGLIRRMNARPSAASSSCSDTRSWRRRPFTSKSRSASCRKPTPAATLRQGRPNPENRFRQARRLSNSFGVVQSCQSRFPLLAADRPSAAAALLPAPRRVRRSLGGGGSFSEGETSSSKTRARKFCPPPSGRPSRRQRFCSMFTPVSQDCGYRIPPGLGKWPSRDPLEEYGGVALTTLNRNDPVNKVDSLGLLTRQEVADNVISIARNVSNIPCCCGQKPPQQIKPTLSWTASGSSVNLTATTPLDGNKCPIVILTYVWWDCYKAQDDFKNINGPIQKGDLTWQSYGFHYGSNVQSKSATPPFLVNNFPFYDPYDSLKWNWQVSVIYLVCDKNGFLTAKSADSDQLLFHWVNYDGAPRWDYPINPHE